MIQTERGGLGRGLFPSALQGGFQLLAPGDDATRLRATAVTIYRHGMRNDTIAIRLTFVDGQDALSVHLLSDMLRPLEGAAAFVLEQLERSGDRRLYLVGARHGSLDLHFRPGGEPTPTLPPSEPNQRGVKPRTVSLAALAQVTSIIGFVWSVVLGPNGIVAQHAGVSRPSSQAPEELHVQITTKAAENKNLVDSLDDLEKSAISAGVKSIEFTVTDDGSWSLPIGARTGKGVLAAAVGRKQSWPPPPAAVRRNDSSEILVELAEGKYPAFLAVVDGAVPPNRPRTLVVVWKSKAKLPKEREVVQIRASYTHPDNVAVSGPVTLAYQRADGILLVDAASTWQ